MAAARKTTTPPIAAEALAEAIPFDFDGLSLSVKPSSEWTVRALDRLERGYVTTWLELVLGEKDYAAVIDAELKPEALGRLVQATQKAAGIASS
jgi:hypothetical protein